MTVSACKVELNGTGGVVMAKSLGSKKIGAENKAAGHLWLSVCTHARG